MTDFIITCDASKVSPSEFLNAVLGPPLVSRQERYERDCAFSDYQSATFNLRPGRLEHQDQLNRCREEYAQRIREIAAKYGADDQLTECRPDPLLRRVA